MVFSKPPFTFFPSFYHIRSCPNAHPERKCGNQTRRTGCFSPFHAISWWLCRRYAQRIDAHRERRSSEPLEEGGMCHATIRADRGGVRGRVLRDEARARGAGGSAQGGARRYGRGGVQWGEYCLRSIRRWATAGLPSERLWYRS